MQMELDRDYGNGYRIEQTTPRLYLGISDLNNILFICSTWELRFSIVSCIIYKFSISLEMTDESQDKVDGRTEKSKGRNPVNFDSIW